MAGLPREVIRWLQSLDLTWQVKNTKWDLANGYLVAEIFSWYYPQAIQMNYFQNGQSIESKQLNWNLINLFIKKHGIDIPLEYTEGTMHSRDGAASALIEKMYEILTNRQVRKKEGHNNDFTDRAYQNKLPMHARSTASMTVKNNLKITELKTDISIDNIQLKAHNLIRQHVEQRRQDRIEDPARFDIKPTVGEKATRKAPPTSSMFEESSSTQVSAARAAVVPSAPTTAVLRKSGRKGASEKQEQRQETPTQKAPAEVMVQQMMSPITQTLRTGA